MARALSVVRDIWELGMTDEYLMLWSLVAADRHAPRAPHCRSRTISFRSISRILALLIHKAIAASLSSSLVQGVARSVLGSAAPAVLVPPQLRPRRRRRLVEALVPPRHRRRLVGVRHHWSCPRSVVPVWWSDV